MMRTIGAFLTIVMLVLIGAPDVVFADAVCNGNALAGAKLRSLTAVAAAATLRATADFYQMIAFFEEGPRGVDAARSPGVAAVNKLSESVSLLEGQATVLPEGEFQGITQRLKTVDYAALASRFGIAPTAALWREVSQAAGQGGRGWLAECIRSRAALRDQTRAFVTGLAQMPKASEIWRLMVLWRNELDRQRYLTMLLTE